MIKRFALLFLCLGGSLALTEEFSVDQLLGQWEFTSYAEASSPEERTPVGVLFEFRQAGVLVTRSSTGVVESSYSIAGAIITYSDARGEQTWTIREFKPGVSIVIENNGTLMYFERR